jgi:hypothetical protein
VSTASGGRVLDTTALLHIATGTTPYARELVDTAITAGLTLAVPSAALAAAWAAAAPAGRLFIDDLLDRSPVVVDPLDSAGARTAGVVVTGGRAPIEQGHVVASARARGWPVITGQPGRLLALAAEVDTRALP